MQITGNVLPVFTTLPQYLEVAEKRSLNYLQHLENRETMQKSRADIQILS